MQLTHPMNQSPPPCRDLELKKEQRKCRVVVQTLQPYDADRGNQPPHFFFVSGHGLSETFPGSQMPLGKENKGPATWLRMGASSHLVLSWGDGWDMIATGAR